MTTMIDTGVLIGVLQQESPYHEWACQQLEACKADGPVVISDIVFCEFSVAMPDEETASSVVQELALEMVRADRSALYNAGQKFKEYKELNKGPKLGVLPDFLIGATAQTMGVKLVTTNEKDFVHRFPSLHIVSPANEND